MQRWHCDQNFAESKFIRFLKLASCKINRIWDFAQNPEEKKTHRINNLRDSEIGAKDKKKEYLTTCFLKEPIQFQRVQRSTIQILNGIFEGY